MDCHFLDLQDFQISEARLKDNLPHNTYQIYVKPHLKNAQMTLEHQSFD